MEKKLPTKKALAVSLLELCDKRSADRVTIEQIVDYCGYSRKTFYNNFDSKLSLILWLFMDKCNEIIRRYADNEPWAVVLGRMYSYMYEKKFLFGKNWSSDQLVFLVEDIEKYVQNYYIETATELHGVDCLSDEFLFLNRYNSYAATRIVIEWIRDGFIMSPEELGTSLDNALPPLVKQYTNRYLP